MNYSASGWRGVVRGFVLVLVLASAAFAQAPTGNIRGEVTDPTGAVIADATVKVTEVATGRTIESKTNASGLYSALLLLPGTYKVRIEAAGFTPAVLEVVVRAGQTVDANASLQVGATAGTVVEVMGVGEAQVDTTRATVDGNITGKQFDQLPVNGRNFFDLASLEPGVIVRGGGNIDPTKVNAYRVIGIAGRGGTGTRVQVDGIDVTDETVGSTVYNLSTDAVLEFQLSRSNQDMSTSLGGSGAVSVITRSGGNEIHGSSFYFYRNQDMGARLGFLQTQPDFKRHQVGYRVGGPFLKDKLFWFSNWERTYQDEGQIFTSDSIFPIIANTFPFPAGAPNCASGCSGTLPLGIRTLSQRLDWNVTSNTRLFYRFGHSWDESAGGSINSPFQNVDWTNVHTVGLDWSQRQLTHSYRFGYVNFNNQIVSQELSGFAFPRTPNGTPFFLGVGAFSLGPNSLAPQQTYQDNFQNKYDGSWVFGKHTFRYGLEVNRIAQGVTASFAGILTIGGTFTPATQAAVAAAGGDTRNPFAYPFSSFLTGSDVGFFTRKPAHNFPHGGHFNTRVAWYFGDTWKMLRNLTVSLGTRWEWDSGYFPTDEAIMRPSFLNFWQQGAANEPRFPKDKFGPHVGFAWDPWSNGKTSIRGGYYLAYELNIFNNTLFDPFALLPPGLGPSEFTESGVLLPNGMPVTPASIGNPALPASCMTATATAELAGGDWSCLTGGNSVQSVIPIIEAIDNLVKTSFRNFTFSPVGTPEFINSLGVVFGGIIPGTAIKIPYSQQFNIGFQREITRGNVFSLDLVYNHGVGVPYMLPDFECRRCANTLNVAAAQARITSTLASAPGGPYASVAAFIAANPTATIAQFGLARDTVFRGRTPDPTSSDPTIQSTNFLRQRLLNAVGFSKYLGLQAQMRGRYRDKWRVIKNVDYVLSYALGRSEATNGSIRVEFLNNPIIKNRPQDKQAFGPVSELDRTHQLAAGVILDIPGGFRLNQIWTFRTAPALNLFVPTRGGVSGSSALFTTDLNGDGNIGGGGPQVDILPGTSIGDFNRTIGSWDELNAIITAYNTNVAGTLTPAGQALVAAGLFTQAELVALRAVAPTIPLVPTTNPWPFHNFFNLDLRITRPISLKFIREGMSVEPYLDVFNLFNNTGLNPYGGLSGGFGSLNFDYRAPANQAGCGGDCVAALNGQRGRNGSTRLLQIGVRVNF